MRSLIKSSLSPLFLNFKAMFSSYNRSLSMFTRRGFSLVKIEKSEFLFLSFLKLIGGCLAVIGLFGFEKSEFFALTGRKLLDRAFTFSNGNSSSLPESSSLFSDIGDLGSSFLNKSYI